MAVFQYGDLEYDIDDAKVARRNGDGTYGTLIDVTSINMARITFNAKTQDGRGDGGITAVASANESGSITIRNLGIPDGLLSTFYGMSSDEYGSGDSAYKILDMVAGYPFPYFGMVLRSFDNENAGSGALIEIPKIKIMSNFDWNLSYNEFVQPEMTGRVLPDGSLGSFVTGFQRFVRVYKFRTLPQITRIPVF